jgi:hypothetical protein
MSDFRLFKYCYPVINVTLSNGKTIRISEDTYQELSNQGTLSETFDTVIKKLIAKGKEKI